MQLDEMGTRIKTYRLRLGFTQYDLASALQVSPQAVSKWERGENAPDIATLPALSEVLAVSIDTLLGANFRDKRTMDATIVYADMQGLGPLARQLSPADLAITLNAFFYPLTEHLIAQDGIPITYAGDELLAVFAGENHRLRAFRAAFAARTASPRPLRLSISSGPVWMGAIGHPLHARPDVLGEPVYLASAIQDWIKSAAPGGVAADDGAVAPIRQELKLGRSEEIGSWSRESPFRVHEVLGLR